MYVLISYTLVFLQVKHHLTEIIDDTIEAIRTVKLFSNENEHLTELETSEKTVKRVDLRSSILTGFESTLATFSNRLTYAVILLFSFWMIKTDEVNSLTPGSVGAFILFYDGIEKQVRNH